MNRDQISKDTEKSESSVVGLLSRREIRRRDGQTPTDSVQCVWLTAGMHDTSAAASAAAP